MLVRDGFRGRSTAPPATRDLCGLLLPDSGRLQEEEAGYANKQGLLQARPERAPALHRGRRAGGPAPPAHARLRGAAARSPRASPSASTAPATSWGAPRWRWSWPASPPSPHPLQRRPGPLRRAHPARPRARRRRRRPARGEHLRRQAATRAGTPAQALQAEVLRRGAAARASSSSPPSPSGARRRSSSPSRSWSRPKAIPELPVYVDSPMAVDATPFFLAHREDHDDEMARRIAAGEEPLRPARLSLRAEPGPVEGAERPAPGPSSSCRPRAWPPAAASSTTWPAACPIPRTTVLLVGFQAAGTRGASLQQGAPFVRDPRRGGPVKARVATISGFSAHADEDEIARWLGSFPVPARRTFWSTASPRPFSPPRHAWTGSPGRRWCRSSSRRWRSRGASSGAGSGVGIRWAADFVDTSRGGGAGPPGPARRPAPRRRPGPSGAPRSRGRRCSAPSSHGSAGSRSWRG